MANILTISDVILELGVRQGWQVAVTDMFRCLYTSDKLYYCGKKSCPVC